MPDHLALSSTESRLAIIAGDPERVPIISSYFEQSHQVSTSRNFLCHQGSLKQSPVLVVSSGIGAPSTAIVVEELIDLGVTTIVRLGTCGALQPKVKVGDLVISSGCVRDEGTSRQYIESIFPAIPDYALLHELITGAAGKSIPCHVGITHCKDAYYLERPAKQLDPARVAQRWEQWRQAGVLVTEMESSALFVLGSLRRIRTGALLINVGKVTDPELFRTALESAIEIIKTAFSALIDKDLIETKISRRADDESYLTGKTTANQ